MAYLDLAQAYPADLSSSRSPKAPAAAAQASLSALEWSVVALARRDRVSSLAEPGRISVAMGRLFGTQSNPRLADPRLEALRRLAVQAWHHGYVLPKSEIKNFLSAGFTLDQFETLLKSISSQRLVRGRKYP
jgi:hypothetical protein